MRRTNLIGSMAVVAMAAWWLGGLVSVPVLVAQTQTTRNATREDFDRLMTELSNWGRWGAGDELGAINLITPDKRKRALATVKDGVTVSLARVAEMSQAVDNPRPIVREMIPGRGRAAGAPPPDIAGFSDSFSIAYHGFVHTHMDSFCHRLYKGKMYNGIPIESVTPTECTRGSVFNYKNGIVTRAVLMDIPRLKGVDYLEPGTRIYPEDLDAWAKQARIKFEPGDAVFIRTGRWARREAKGPWAAAELAGLYITCAKWLRDRDVAILGSDGAQDVHPSGIDGIAEPIHALVLVAMGMPIFDNLDLEAVSKEAAARKRWEFLVTAAPVPVPGETGSVLNPIATF